MGLFQKKDKKRIAIEKEFLALQDREIRHANKVLKNTVPQWRTQLEKVVPDKVFESLQTAFSKGFSLVFSHGTAVIERLYNKNRMEQDHAVQDSAVMIRGSRKELKKLNRNAAKTLRGNAAITTVEGVGLGALGVGLPDIVLFVGMLLKGIYESAVSFGFSYDTPREQLLILKMMEVSLAKGMDYLTLDQELDKLLRSDAEVTKAQVEEQIQKTGAAFALDMLLLKFIQGLPVVGVLGGLGNPVYYNKVLRYVQLKYQKRYLYAVAERSGYALDEIPHKR